MDGQVKLHEASISAAVGVRIKVSRYPDEKALAKAMRDKFPFVDFDIRSIISSSELCTAKFACRRALEPTPEAKGGLIYKTP